VETIFLGKQLNSFTRFDFTGPVKIETALVRPYLVVLLGYSGTGHFQMLESVSKYHHACH